jgi:hypothetical protein
VNLMLVGLGIGTEKGGRRGTAEVVKGLPCEIIANWESI